MSERSVQLKATMNADGVTVGAETGKRSLRDLASAATTAGKVIGESIVDAGRKTEDSTTKIDAATKRAADSIQRTIARVEAAGKGQAAYLEQLASFRGADVGALRPLLDQLAEVEARQKRAAVSAAGFANGTDAAAKSAQLLTYQLRQVGPQFTDIVTSLASGQAPLTVLIQQGGQLKDIFGGIGPAFKALGGYLLGLVNPYTVAAAAIAGIGFAYFQGAKEEREFTKAILLSGNAAGVTAGQLGQMAVNLKSITGSQGAAADALAQFARAGDVGRENLERFTASALAFQKATGQAISDTVKQFEELKKAPLDAAIKLNESTNFLTASIYSQIRALEEQGDKAGAAAVAQKALADSQDQVSAQMRASAGVIERAWNGVTGAIKGAWDALLAIGRASTPAEALGSLDRQIAAMQAQIERSPTAGGNSDRAAAAREQLALLKQQRDALVETTNAEQQTASARAAQTRQVEALVQFDKAGLEVASKRQKMEREIAEARTLGLAAGKSQVEIEQRIALIRDKYKESSGPKGSQVNPLASQAREYANEVEKLLAIQAKYTEGAKDQTDAEKALDAIRRSGTLESLPKAWRDAYLAILQTTQGVEESARAYAEWEKAASKAADRAAALAVTQIDLDEQASSAAERARKSLIDQELATRSIGASKLELLHISLEMIDAQIAEAEYNAASADAGSARQANYAEEVRLLKELKAARAGAFEKQQAIEFNNAMADAAARSATDWQKSADQINQSLTDSLFRAAESGKDAFTTLRDSIKGMFANLILKPVIQAATGGISSAALSAVGGGAGGNNPLGSVGALGSLYNAGSSLLGITAGSAAAYGAFVPGVAAGSAQAAALAAQTGVFGAQGLASTAAAASGASGVGISGSITSALAAIPVWGWALLAAAAIAAVVGQERGGPKLGGSATTGADGARLFTPDVADAQARQVLDSILAANAGIAGKFGGRFTGTASIGFDQDPAGEADSRIASVVRDATGRALLDNSAGRDVGRDSAEFDAQLQVESKRVLLAALQASDLQNGFDEIFARLDPAQAAPDAIDNLFNLAEQLRALGVAALDLPGVMGDVADLSATAREQLVGFAGGLEQLSAQQGTYFAEFFSEQEQLDNASRVLTGRFSEIGLSFEALRANVDGPREAFRDLVEGLDLTTESGRQSYAALLALAGPLDQYLDGLAAQKVEFKDLQATTIGATKAVGDLTDIIRNLEQSISTGEDELADLQEGINAVFRPAETTGQRLVRMAGELDNLSSSLDAITNPGGSGGLAQLQSLIAAQNQLQSARAGIASAIDDQALQGFQARGDTAGAVAFLQALEGRLWAGLEGAADKGAVAGRIQSVFLQRIGLEAGAAQREAEDAASKAVAQAQTVIDLERDARDQRIKGLENEIRAAEQFAGIAENLRRTVADLRFSDLSPLNPQDQLNAAKGEFSRVLGLAQGGDLTALQQIGGVGTSLIQEQRSFGASTPATAAVFQEVTDALTALGVGLGTGDVTDAQRQLEELRAIKDPIVTLTAATVDYSDKAIEGLRAIDTALGAGTDYLSDAITTAIAALQAEVAIQTAALRAEADDAKVRAVALGVELERLRTELAAIKENTGGTRAAVQTAAAAPEVVA